MAIATKAELRLLSREEAQLVAVTRREGISTANDAELRQALGLLRERRDRARTIARQQRREMRGKAQSPSPATDNSGSKMKARVLSGAIQRANRELSRRKGVNARKELVENARRALELKQAARLDQAADGGKPASTTASKGMKPKPSTKAPKIGSANEAGRVSQAVKKAQAKKDAGA